MEIQNLNKIFICHYSKLRERKIILSQQLEYAKLDYEWVEIFNVEDITDNYDKYISGWESFNPILIKQIQNSYKNFSKKLSPSELSLYLKHEYCFKKQIENNWNNILILEDDAELYDHFKNHLFSVMAEFNDMEFGFHIDILELGTAFNLKSLNLRNKKFTHFHPDQKTRCTHAAIFNISATQKIINNLRPINLPIDFKLNEIIQMENLKVAWAEPGIKQNILFKSAIDH
jgi:GR25 family glycosyltransferase involved in LPS biosynthesis